MRRRILVILFLVLAGIALFDRVRACVRLAQVKLINSAQFDVQMGRAGVTLSLAVQGESSFVAAATPFLESKVASYWVSLGCSRARLTSEHHKSTTRHEPSRSVLTAENCEMRPYEDVGYEIKLAFLQPFIKPRKLQNLSVNVMNTYSEPDHEMSCQFDERKGCQISWSRTSNWPEFLWVQTSESPEYWGSNCAAPQPNRQT